MIDSAITMWTSRVGVSLARRYALAFASVAGALLLELLFHHFNLPHSFAAFAMSAIALTFWIDKHISPDFRTLYIQQKAKSGEIQPYLKTKSGEREVDLCCSLAKILRDFVGNRTKGLLFRSSTGAQLLQSNTLRDSLHAVLEEIEHVKGGFNIFRRFRITYLQKLNARKYSVTSGPAMHRSMFPESTPNSAKSGISAWTGRRGLGSDSSCLPQLGNLCNCASSRKWLK